VTRHLIAFALAAVVCGFAWALSALRPEPVPLSAPISITIVATNDLRARDRRCGCEGNRLSQEPTEFVQSCACKKSAAALSRPALGALPERSAWLARLGPHISVDAGDLLFPGLTPDELERDDWARHARLMVEAYGILGVDAYAPGEMDLALGREFFEDTLRDAKFPVVCSNLFDSRTHARLFPASLIVSLKGTTRRVGVIGVFDPQPDMVVLQKISSCGLQVIDPVGPVRAEIESLHHEKVDLVVLVAHAPDPRLRALLRQAPGIDAAFGAHSEFVPEKPGNVEGTTAISCCYPGGGTPNVAAIQLVPGGSGVIDRQDPQEYFLRRARARLDEAVAARKKSTDAAANPKLDAAVEQAQRGVAAAEEALGSPRHVLSLMPTPLVADDLKTGQDPKLLTAIERFKTESETARLPQDVVARAEAETKDVHGLRTGFRTEQECVVCHKPQGEVWQKSAHANAWASLVKLGNEKDPECVRCHSVGFRAPGGFAEIARAVHERGGGQADFRNVQCEDCHGPRAAHPESHEVGVHFPTIDVCRRCHDAAHDPTFGPERLKKALEEKKVCIRNGS
jgi:hypothetical protein